ncbi:disulfide bond formation protein B [Parvularcula dongshanensis]|uniref:Disulfide bond formation protein DsbB n=1 Tax=Parvularcula dongshanensis TaxID=1173995 RepID=A0A840I3S7_9PROT|nr:disulfide bond formation protein DsbB [Parvularcula dongshanensis]
MTSGRATLGHLSREERARQRAAMAASTPLTPMRALGIATLASGALLAGAHAFERFGGLAPCALCLEQREVHWAALTVAGVMLFFARAGAAKVVAAGLGALCVVYLFSTGLAAYHAGVEWGFWKGPSGCAATGLGDGPSVGDLLSGLDAPGPRGPACSEAAWRLGGVSMAGYNVLASASLAAVCLLACVAFARRLYARPLAA